MNDKVWKIYLSGEIHSDWREKIENGCAEAGLPVSFAAPITVHDNSDDCGVAVFGSEPDKFWHDHKGAMLNSVRTSTLIEQSDVVVVRFGEKYKQWNAAFDAGYAAALGKPIITLHPPEHDHALKEVDAAAKGVAREPIQVVQALAYAINGGMPGQWYQKEAAE
jgi:YtoQ family protein